MKVQITLTVNEAKRIIAKGLCRHPLVQKALQHGKIFLKGGTTVSAVAEELIGKPLRISGRISPMGTKTAQSPSAGYHCALIDNKQLLDAENNLQEVVSGLKEDDAAIIGANAIDVHGNAAMMFGAPMGGGAGPIISGLLAETPNVFIAAGLEKLVPGSLTKIIPKISRKGVQASMGMAVGLVPIAGHLITEDKAIEMLAPVVCTVIGRGGIMGAEGATTLLVEGSEEHVQQIFKIATKIKGTGHSGTPESVAECTFPNAKCKTHRGCIYKRKT